MNKTIILFLVLSFLPTFTFADLEWITGETPKATNEKPAAAVVRDAPGEGDHNLTTGNQDVVISVLTTATNVVGGYPADSVNYFYLNKNKQVAYYAYFLIKPSSRIHTAVVEWYSPANICIAKYEKDYRVSFVDRLLTFQNETYQWFLLDMNIGIDHLNAQVGQTGLPRDVGLYTIRLTVDGQVVGNSFFYIKPGDNSQPSPVATVAPQTTVAPGAASDIGILPMSTPMSKGPMPKGLK